MEDVGNNALWEIWEQMNRGKYEKEKLWVILNKIYCGRYQEELNIEDLNKHTTGYMGRNQLRQMLK